MGQRGRNRLSEVCTRKCVNALPGLLSQCRDCCGGGAGENWNTLYREKLPLCFYPQSCKIPVKDRHAHHNAEPPGAELVRPGPAECAPLPSPSPLAPSSSSSSSVGFRVISSKLPSLPFPLTESYRQRHGIYHNW